MNPERSTPDMGHEAKKIETAPKQPTFETPKKEKATSKERKSRTPKNNESASERAAEPEKIEQKRGIGRQMLEALGIKQEPKAGDQATMGEAPLEQPETEKPEASKPVPNPETEEQKGVAGRMLDGARTIGRLAIGLLDRARSTVTTGEEQSDWHTNTDPLDKAEDNVREAMHEVDTVADNLVGAQDEDAHGDYKATYNANTASTKAYVEAGRVMERERLRRERSKTPQTLGVLALGVGAYSWLKARRLHREHAALQKEVGKQAEELRVGTEQREALELELADLKGMDRTQRQELVAEVSDYANAQAERMRDIAHTQERLAQHALKEIVVVDKRMTPEQMTEKVIKTVEKRKNLRERLIEVLSGGKGGRQLIEDAQSAFGGVGAWFGAVVNPAGKKDVTAKKRVAQPKLPKPYDPIQTWLNGALLISGIILLIVILIAVA